jgi:acyl carrier protein
MVSSMWSSEGTHESVGSPAELPTKKRINSLQVLIELVSDHLGVDESEITAETSFTDDLGADSLDVAEIAIAVEDRLGVSIDDAELDRIRTVGQAALMLDAKRGAASGR